MQFRDAISGDRLKEWIASEVEASAFQARLAKVSPNPADPAIDFQVAMQALVVAQETSVAIGNLPPGAPTLRAHIGGILVRMVRRALFWYTPQIAASNEKMLRLAREQIGLAEGLDQILTSTRKQISRLQSDLRREIHDANQLAERLEDRLESAATARNQFESQVRKELFLREAEIVHLRAKLADQERRIAASESPLRISQQVSPGPEPTRTRQRDYAGRLRHAGAGSAGAPVLNIDSGHGAWLDLLREEGLEATGVEANAALSHLRSLPGQSLGAVTGFRIDECLDLRQLVELIDESTRALRKGGVALFETVDGSGSSPLPSELLQFVLVARGLCDVEVVNANGLVIARKP